MSSLYQPLPASPQQPHRWKKACDRAFQACCLLAILSCAAILMWMLGGIVAAGYKNLSLRFLVSTPSMQVEKMGIGAGILGTLWLMGLTALFSIPAGVGAALYLEEYATKTPWRRLVQFNISNLASVPSIVYGILALAVFVQWMRLHVSLLSGAGALSLVILPIVIVSAQEALRAVPASFRTASYALGATRWQTIWRTVLPSAAPGIFAGTIFSLSRAMGEAAPLIVVGTADYVSRMPHSPLSNYTALPVQIFNFAADPRPAVRSLAPTAIIVLLVLLISMNALAVFVRQRYGKHYP